jgi:hypothetical protein
MRHQHFDRHKGQVNLTPIIYLHKISEFSDNRMSWSQQGSLRSFKSLLGKNNAKNAPSFGGPFNQDGELKDVIVVTTMWGQVKKEIGERREEELKNVVFAKMVAAGCRVQRFEDTPESAWRIVDCLTARGLKTLRQQRIVSQKDRVIV